MNASRKEKVRRSWEWDKALYSKLEEIAAREHRTVASQALYYVTEGIKRDEQKGVDHG